MKKTFLLLGDIIFLYAALLTALFFRYSSSGWDYWSFVKIHLLPFTIIFILWLIVFGAFELYDFRFAKNSKLFFYKLFEAMIVNVALAAIIFYLAPLEIEPRTNLFLIAAASVFFTAGWRYLFNLFIVRAPSSKILFFGINKDAIELADWFIKNPQLGQKPIAFMSANSGHEEETLSLPRPLFASTEDITHVVEDYKIDTIVILREIKENKILVNALFQIIPKGIAIMEFTPFFERFTGKVPLSLIGEVWFLENLVGIKRPAYEFFKRLTDIALAIIAGPPSLLIFPFIALAIKLDSSGPVFYRQKRVGKNGKVFELIKYRSMVAGADKIEGLKQDGNDHRHTRVGKFLRKSYLDEFPQIINILKGDMSFIGPRPERPEYARELKQKIPFYEMRTLVAPGITGWAQVKMENDASVEDAPEKMQYDLYYVKNRVFILDLLIASRTIFAILQRQGR